MEQRGLPSREVLSEEGPVLKGIQEWWGRVRGWPTFRGIVVAGVLFALILYGVALRHQARESSREASHLLWATQSVDWSSEGPRPSERALLSIAYPGELRLELTAEARPISVWLWRATPARMPWPTKTPTDTPMPTDTPTPSSLGTSSEALPPTPTVTNPPTPTLTPGPWIVAFSPHDQGILFVDQKGEPVGPQVLLTPGSRSAAPAALFVQRAPLATAAASTSLQVSVYGPDGEPVGDSALPTPDVVLESAGDSMTRRFWDLFLGPTTPLLALVGSIVPLALGADVSALMDRRGLLKQSGETASLLGPKDRTGIQNLGLPDRSGPTAPVVDVLHRAVTLWEHGERQALDEFLAEGTRGREDQVRLVAQTLINILPNGDAERRLLEGFLAGRDVLPEVVRQERLF